MTKAAVEKQVEVVSALPDEIRLDPTRAPERAWRVEAVQLYDELSHEQRVAWACDCVEHAPTSDGVFDVLGKIRGGSAKVEWPYPGLGATGLVQCLRDLNEQSGIFMRPGIGVASWCQVLAGDAEAERAWQLEQLRALAA